MKKIIMICSQSNSSKYLYNNIVKSHSISKVIIVQKEKRFVFLKKRIRKLGFGKVIGQMLFLIYTRLFLRKKAIKRICEINKDFNLGNHEIPLSKVKYIESVNSLEMEKLLEQQNPDLIIINGTPIIKENIINSTKAKFLNIHAGITPKYRGVHGGYWSLFNGEENLFGVTTHFVDKGIDTGSILEQRIIKVHKDDNFLTYPHLQLATSLINYNNIISSVLKDDYTIKKPLVSDSDLWTHPTITQYIFGRIFKNVK